MNHRAYAGLNLLAAVLDGAVWHSYPWLAVNTALVFYHLWRAQRPR